jgi:hypothetical protein
MTTLRSISAVSFAVLLSASAARAEEAPVPPEVARTADAFNGRWTVDATLTMGASSASRLKVTLTCHKVARGRAASCTLAGRTPMGPMEGAMLVGYNALDKAVHFMAMTSDGEVHDHTCRWQGDALGCDRLKGNMGALAVTEDLSFRFEGGRMSFQSLTVLPDGTQVAFAGAGKK